MGSVSVNVCDDGALTVVVSADIDADTDSRLRKVLVAEIMHRRPHRLVVDLADVTDLDSETIGTLQAAQDTAAAVNVQLWFRTAGSPLAELLHYHGILDSRSGDGIR